MPLSFIGAEPVELDAARAVVAEDLSGKTGPVLRFIGAEPVDAKTLQQKMQQAYAQKTLGFVGAEPVDLKDVKSKLT